MSFSCLTGHRKPEPETYLTATRALGVDPHECLFVGDGGSRELTGAAALGMTAVRFAPPGRPVGDAVDVDADWVGVELGDLGELLDLLEGPAQENGPRTCLVDLPSISERAVAPGPARRRSSA